MLSLHMAHVDTGNALQKRRPPVAYGPNASIKRSSTPRVARKPDDFTKKRRGVCELGQRPSQANTQLIFIQTLRRIPFSPPKPPATTQALRPEQTSSQIQMAHTEYIVFIALAIHGIDGPSALTLLAQSADDVPRPFRAVRRKLFGRTAL